MPQSRISHRRHPLIRSIPPIVAILAAVGLFASLAVAQQPPCAQLADAHSVRSEQNAPFGLSPHEFPTHTLPGEQFASIVQAPKHLLPLHANGTHASASGATHVPVVLQVDAGVYLLFSQCSAAHTVPERYRRQPPAPSHFPSVPQVDAAWVAHMLRMSSFPAGIGVRPGSCRYPLRTLVPTGLIVGQRRGLTLGDLFAVWGQPLSAHRLAGFRGPVVAFVGGRRVGGDVRSIPIRHHAQIVVEVSGYVPPHAHYVFPRSS